MLRTTALIALMPGAALAHGGHPPVAAAAHDGLHSLIAALMAHWADQQLGLSPATIAPPHQAFRTSALQSCRHGQRLQVPPAAAAARPRRL